jgi:hypothetical protein
MLEGTIHSPRVGFRSLFRAATRAGATALHAPGRAIAPAFWVTAPRQGHASVSPRQAPRPPLLSWPYAPRAAPAAWPPNPSPRRRPFPRSSIQASPNISARPDGGSARLARPREAGTTGYEVAASQPHGRVATGYTQSCRARCGGLRAAALCRWGRRLRSRYSLVPRSRSIRYGDVMRALRSGTT